MTVTATNRKNSFTTNGVTTNFAFTFAVTSDQQIKALVRDALGVETPYTNFTTALNPSAEGGTLTTLDVLDDATLVIYRETPFTQQLDYVEGGRFPAESHEAAIDKLTLQNQDQAEILDRALVSSISDEAPPTLEEYTDEIDAKDSATLASANNYTDQQVFDSGGWNQALSTANIKEVTPTLTNLQAASVADMIVGVTIGGEVIPHEIGQAWGIYGQWKVKTISNPMTINDFATVYAVNIKDFGAIGDGVADDTQAIQDALDFATANSSVVDAAHPWYGYIKLPTGRFRVTETLNVPRGVYIEGCNGKTTRLCTIVMDNTNNLPIFDLFGVEMPNGTRVADQRIQGIHFFNQNGHAIRAVAADYPNAVSHGSIEIHNNHFLNCNGDFAVQGEYIEIITGNTFDYAQVGHIKAKTLPNCYGNEFYRGIGGAVVLDTDLGSGGVLASLIVSNSFKECGTSSGANDSAIVLKGTDPLGAVSIVGNTFTGTGSGGIGALRTIAEVDSILFNCNMIDGLFGSVYATGRVNAASIQSNVISNTVGTGSSFPNVLFLDVGKASVQNNVFKDTANTLDISITLAEDGIVTGNLTDKYALTANISSEYTDGTNLIKAYNTPVRYNFSDPNEAIANQSWFLGTHVFARMHSDGNQTVTWNNNPAVFYVNKTSAGRSINAGGTINASGADYAEYMTKTADCGELTKGDICGITSDGLLTDKFSKSITFVVKSTNPSYVGGDDWGTGLEGAELEEARNKVDRIAFCGQVPVNTSANVGDYIIPVVGDSDTIVAASTQTPSLEEYIKSLGRVIKINDKPVIIVKTA